VDQLGARVIVVDVNLLVYLTVGTGAFGELTRAARKQDRNWMAPSFWRSEFRNAMFGYIRRGDLTVEEALEAHIDAELAVTSRRIVPRTVLELASQTRASAYDCEYVALARALQVRLVTADVPLVKEFPETCVSLEQFAA